MTEDQCRQAAEIMADLIDSYIVRHRADPPRDHGIEPGGGQDRAHDDVPPLAERQDLLGRAVAIWLTRPEPRSYLEGQLRGADAQIRKDKQATDRYLHGFETGALPEELLSERVQELKLATAALTKRKKELTGQLRSMSSQRNADCLEGVSVAEFLQDVFDAHTNLPAVKSLLRLHIDELLIDGLNVRPVFRAPPWTSASASKAAGNSLSPWVIADSIWGRARWALRERTLPGSSPPGRPKGRSNSQTWTSPTPSDSHLPTSGRC